MLYRKNLWVLREEEKRGGSVLEDGGWLRTVREVEKQMWTLSIVYPVIIT
jgi:hypothetical protein